MALLKTVVRKYTPPTCTLEVRGQESLLSKWAGRTILQNLKFKLSFDDPRQPDDKQVSIWGDRVGLEALSTAVTEYVQNFLQSQDGLVETNGKEPVVDSVPRKKGKARALKDLAATEIKPNPAIVEETTSTKVIPLSPILQTQTLNPYLKPKGLVTHELFLGALQTPESGASIDLSAIQLFDLATALDTCSAEILNMPALAKSRPVVPLWGYAAGAAAALVAAVGLAPAAMRLASTSNSTLVVVPPAEQTPAITAANPNADAAIAPVPANPASPTPLGSPLPGVVSAPNGNLPFGSGSPNAQSIPSVGGSTGVVPPGVSVPPGVAVPPGSTLGQQPAPPNGLSGTGAPIPTTTTIIPGNQSPSKPQSRNSKIASSNTSGTRFGITPGLNGIFGRSSSTPSSRRNGKNQYLNSVASASGTNSGRPQSTRSNRRSSTPTVLGTGKVDRNVSNTVLTDDSTSGLSALSGTTATTQESNKPLSRQNSTSRSRKNPVKVTRKQSQSPNRIPTIADTNIAFGTSPVVPSSDFTFSSPVGSETPVDDKTASATPREPDLTSEASSPNPAPKTANNVRPNLGSLPELADNRTQVSPLPSIQPGTPDNAPTPGNAAVLAQSETAIATATAPIVPNPALNRDSVSRDLTAINSLDSQQLSEVKSYFESEWKPIKEVKESLQYVFKIDSNGSVATVTPVTQLSTQYITRVGMPQRTNTPRFSPVNGGRSLRIRVVLEPDGTVKTFQEQ